MAKALSCFLVTISDETSTVKKVIDDRVCTIGRALDSTLSFAHPEVSRLHCIISYKHDKLWIEDQESSNGTFLDGERIQGKKQIQITTESKIKLGKSQIILTFEVFEKVFDEESTKRLKLPEEERETLLEVVRAAQAEAAKVVKAGQDQHDRLLKSAEQKASGLQQQTLLKQEEILQTAHVNANKMIQDAKQEAAKVVLQSEEDAERAVQNVYAKAETFRDQAEKYYQQKVKESEVKGDEIIKKNQEMGQNILLEARNKAQSIRDSVIQESEAIIKAGKEKAESAKVEIFQKVKREAEESARIEVLHTSTDLIKRAESDALNIIEKATQQESQIRVSIRALEANLASFQKTVDEKNTLQSEVDLKIKKLIEERDSLYVDVNGLQAEYKEIGNDIKEGHSKIESLKAETKNYEDGLKTIQEQIRVSQDIQGKVAMDIEERKQSLEDMKISIEAEAQGYKAKLLNELDKLKQDHADEMNRIKTQDIEIAKKIKQEYIDELFQEKEKLTKDILERIEFKVVKQLPENAWMGMSPEISKEILQMIEKRTMSITTAVNQAKNLDIGDPKQRRRRESISMLTMGLLVGIGSVFAFKAFSNHFINRDIAAEDAKAATKEHDEDLERRKFNPDQSYQVRDTYSESVLYTKEFSKVYLDNEFQIKWTKEITNYLLTQWRLDEEKSIQLASLSAALVEALEEKRKQIHPDRIQLGIKKMEDLESENVVKMKEILGGDVKYEAFKRFEKRFVEGELAKKIPASD